MLVNNGVDQREVAIQQSDRLRRRMAFAECSEVADIGEEYGDVTFLAAEFDVFIEQLFDHFVRRDLAENVANLIALGQAFGHVVERRGEFTDFVVVGKRNWLGIVASGDTFRAFGQPAYGSRDAAGDTDAADERDEHAHDSEKQQRKLECFVRLRAVADGALQYSKDAAAEPIDLIVVNGGREYFEFLLPEQNCRPFFGSDQIILRLCFQAGADSRLQCCRKYRRRSAALFAKKGNVQSGNLFELGC